MKKLLVSIAALLAACSSSPPQTDSVPSSPVAGTPPPPGLKETTREAVSNASTLDAYKVDLANRIAQVNATRVYEGRPQALLRSVIVVRYSVDASGNLVRSEIMRSNRDAATEATALASLRTAAPFPKPGRHLLRQGRVDISESFLFNTDGRFQLRSIAQAQMSE